MIARREAALLEARAVDHELDQPRVDAERIHQGAAFGGSAIGGDAAPLALQPLQQRQQFLLQPGDAIAEVAVILEAQQALGFFLRQQFDDARGWRLARMRDEQPQRAAMDRHQLDIADDEAMTPAEGLDRAHRIVAEVLVIDRVEFQLGDEIAHIWRLDDGNAVAA